MESAHPSALLRASSRYPLFLSISSEKPFSSTFVLLSCFYQFWTPRSGVCGLFLFLLVRGVDRRAYGYVPPWGPVFTDELLVLCLPRLRVPWG